MYLRKHPFIIKKKTFICDYQNRDYKLISTTDLSMVEYRYDNHKVDVLGVSYSIALITNIFEFIILGRK